MYFTSILNIPAFRNAASPLAQFACMHGIDARSVWRRPPLLLGNHPLGYAFCHSGIKNSYSEGMLHNDERILFHVNSTWYDFIHKFYFETKFNPFNFEKKANYQHNNITLNLTFNKYWCTLTTMRYDDSTVQWVQFEKHKIYYFWGHPQSPHVEKIPRAKSWLHWRLIEQR